MPNWASNTIAIRGEKSKVINFLNSGLEDSKKLTDLSFGQTIDVTHLSLRSFLPVEYPFNEFELGLDLTNHMKSKNDFDNPDMKWNPTLETRCHELYKTYEEYVKAYNELKEKQLAAAGVSGWYYYNLLTLGTKWDSEFDNGQLWAINAKNEYVIRFDCETAWNAPEQWLINVQEKYPDLTFMMFGTEESNAYCGIFYGNGEYEGFESKEFSDIIDKYREKFEEENEDGDFWDSQEYEDSQEEITNKIDKLFVKFRNMIIEI